MLLDARCKLFVLVSVLFVSSSPVTVAQDTIRVQTNQVLVPVVVINKEKFRRTLRDGSLFHTVLPGEADAIASGDLVHDLTAADFQVLDDGKEQPVQKVTEEPSLYWDVRDNRGYHTEYMGPGGGKWTTAEWPPGQIGDIDPPQHYIIAYSVPESPEGSCHRIKVKVNRPNVLIRVRDEYCNIKHSASDPANGTRLGHQLESDLASPKSNNVDISLIAVQLFTNTDTAPVHIALDWPWHPRKPEFGSKTKGVLGMVFDKQGSLVTRFSDLADREGVSDRPKSVDVMDAEDRYEAQLILSPGEYDLRIAVGDGKIFGRAEISVAVGAFDRKALAISAVSLCKRIDDVSASGRGSILPGAWTAELPRIYMPLVSNGVEFKPTATTRFKKGETLYSYFEVYEPLLAGQTSATVQIQMRIVDVKTGEVKSDSQPVSATPYVKPGSPVIPIGRGIDIGKLPKGSYRLDVQATDSVGKSTAWRTANFTVE
jgi:hypothetical protein